MTPQDRVIFVIKLAALAARGVALNPGPLKAYVDDHAGRTRATIRGQRKKVNPER